MLASLRCSVRGRAQCFLEGIITDNFVAHAASRGSSSQTRAPSDQRSVTEYNLIETDQRLVRIDGFSSDGFVVNNVSVEGALLAYQQVWMMWNVKCLSDVTPDSMEFVRLLRPVPDLVIFGSGAKHMPLPRATAQSLKAHGVHLESLSTARAVEYFNLLNQEQRSVVAFLLPEI